MLEIKNLKKRFSTKEVLKEVNMHFERGHVYGLLGNNGAGKTTLLRIIFNELNLDQGEIKFDDLEQRSVDYSQWMYFVENNELPKEMKVIEYLTQVGRLACLEKSEIPVRIDDTFRLLNPNFKAKTKIKNLSAGQKKIVSCLALMVVKPRVIFFDEPTANLDQENKQIIHQMIQSLASDERIIVIVTHLIEEVQDLLTDVVILDGGEVKLQRCLEPQDVVRDIFDHYVPKVKNNSMEIGAYLNE